MKPLFLILILASCFLSHAVLAQAGKGYTTETTIIKNADLVGDNEIDTGSFTILRFSRSYDIPGVIDEEHERFVFFKVKSLDNLAFNKTYTLPNSEILARTFFESPWSFGETEEISGTITRIEKNDTAELFRLNITSVNEEGNIDTLVWDNYLFKYDTSYFQNSKTDYNGNYDNLRIALKEPLKVRKLDLSYKGIWRYQKNRTGKQEVPPEIGNLKNLEELNLTLQDLQTLPAEFSQLTSLKILDLSYNAFASFPAVIFSCTKLDSLNLQLSQIGYVPAEISKLKNLKKLILDDNRLQTFPLSVTNLPELRDLSITNGNVKTIPKEIGKLRTLERLDLSNFWNYDRKNTCDSLENLSLLANLKELNLKWTKIKSLPSGFSKLEKLEILNIGFNDFKSFPEVIDKLPKLKLLIISHEEFDKNTMSKLRKRNRKYKVQIETS